MDLDLPTATLDVVNVHERDQVTYYKQFEAVITLQNCLSGQFIYSQK